MQIGRSKCNSRGQNTKVAGSEQQVASSRPTRATGARRSFFLRVGGHSGRRRSRGARTTTAGQPPGARSHPARLQPGQGWRSDEVTHVRIAMFIDGVSAPVCRVQVAESPARLCLCYIFRALPPEPPACGAQLTPTVPIGLVLVCRARRTALLPLTTALRCRQRRPSPGRSLGPCARTAGGPSRPPKPGRRSPGPAWRAPT